MASQCLICHQTIYDFPVCPTGENTALPCGHTYHTECLENFGLARETHWSTLPCPTCKVVPAVAVALEESIAQGPEKVLDDEPTPQDRAEEGLAPTDIEEDAESVADTVAPPSLTASELGDLTIMTSPAPPDAEETTAATPAPVDAGTQPSSTSTQKPGLDDDVIMEALTDEINDMLAQSQSLGDPKTGEALTPSAATQAPRSKAKSRARKANTDSAAATPADDSKQDANSSKASTSKKDKPSAKAKSRARRGRETATSQTAGPVDESGSSSKDMAINEIDNNLQPEAVANSVKDASAEPNDIDNKLQDVGEDTTEADKRKEKGKGKTKGKGKGKGKSKVKEDKTPSAKFLLQQALFSPVKRTSDDTSSSSSSKEVPETPAKKTAKTQDKDSAQREPKRAKPDSAAERKPKRKTEDSENAANEPKKAKPDNTGNSAMQVNKAMASKQSGDGKSNEGNEGNEGNDASHSVFDTAGPNDFFVGAETIRCSGCRNPIVPSALRIRSKSQEAAPWCKTCNTSVSKMYKLGFKPKSIKDLSEENAMKFWTDVKDVKTKEELQQVFDKHTRTVEEKKEIFYEDVGEFQPICWYEKQGYNAESIENIKNCTRPENIMDHEVFGKVYRVAILKSGNNGRQGTTSRHTMECGNNRAEQEEASKKMLRLQNDIKALQKQSKEEKRVKDNFEKQLKPLKEKLSETREMLEENPDAHAKATHDNFRSLSAKVKELTAKQDKPTIKDGQDCTNFNTAPHHHWGQGCGGGIWDSGVHTITIQQGGWAVRGWWGQRWDGGLPHPHHNTTCIIGNRERGVDPCMV